MASLLKLRGLLLVTLMGSFLYACEAKVSLSGGTEVKTTTETPATTADSKKSDNTKEVEKTVSESLKPILIGEGINSPIQSISCPEVDPIKTDKVIDCEATLKEGNFPVKVTFKDEKGNIRAEPKRLIPLSKAEKAIQEKINAEATADCGGTVFVIQKVGETFTCKATEKAGKTHNVKVTVTDESGKVEFSIDPS